MTSTQNKSIDTMLDEVRIALDQRKAGLTTVTECVNQIVDLARNVVVSAEYETEKKAEERNGLTVMVALAYDDQAALMAWVDGVKPSLYRDQRAADLAKVEKAIDWLEEFGYKVSCDENRVFWITDPSDDEDGYRVFDRDPKVIVEAHEFLQSTM